MWTTCKNLPSAGAQSVARCSVCQCKGLLPSAFEPPTKRYSQVFALPGFLEQAEQLGINDRFPIESDFMSRPGLMCIPVVDFPISNLAKWTLLIYPSFHVRGAGAIFLKLDNASDIGFTYSIDVNATISFLERTQVAQEAAADSNADSNSEVIKDSDTEPDFETNQQDLNDDDQGPHDQRMTAVLPCKPPRPRSSGLISSDEFTVDSGSISGSEDLSANFPEADEILFAEAQVTDDPPLLLPPSSPLGLPPPIPLQLPVPSPAQDQNDPKCSDVEWQEEPEQLEDAEGPASASASSSTSAPAPTAADLPATDTLGLPSGWAKSSMSHSFFTSFCASNPDLGKQSLFDFMQMKRDRHRYLDDENQLYFFLELDVVKETTIWTGKLLSLPCGHMKCLVCFPTEQALDGDDYSCSCGASFPRSTFEQSLPSHLLGDLQFKLRQEALRLQNVVMPTRDLIAKLRTADSLTATATDYFHYTCCGEPDGGWGCAYRCLQMLVSNYILHDPSLRLYTDRSPRHYLFRYRDASRWRGVPSLRMIQEQLAHLHQIPATDIGSSRWIEPPDCGVYLKSYGILSTDCKFEHIPNSLHLCVFKALLIEHFVKEGTPIMIDDTIKAYCVLGVRLNEDRDVVQCLRFDPHIFRYSDGMNGKSGADWLPFNSVFPNRTKWLVLFPQRKPIVTVTVEDEELL